VFQMEVQLYQIKTNVFWSENYRKVWGGGNFEMYFRPSLCMSIRMSVDWMALYPYTVALLKLSDKLNFLYTAVQTELHMSTHTSPSVCLHYKCVWII
jgi:hypothetical protein